MARLYSALLLIVLCSGLSEVLSRTVTPKSRATAGLARSVSECTPMVEKFQSSRLPASWIQLSTNPQAHKMIPGGGVNLALNPPVGPVLLSSDGKTNDKLGDGSTLNSTYSFL
jgi:hypothetical protein